MELLDITSPFYSLIRGGMIMLFIYHLIVFLQSRDKIYKYYTAYLFCLTIYMIRDAFPQPLVQEFYKYISFPIQYIGYVYFISFCEEIMNGETISQKLSRRVKLLSKILVISTVVLILIQIIWGYEVQKKAMSYSSVLLTSTAFYFFYLLYKIKTKQGLFLLIGSIIFLILANVSAIKMIRGEYYLIDFKVHRMFYYFIGALMQSTVFAIVTGNYFSQIQENKKEAEVNLLKQMNQIYELKITALKSQMNPHFLFNSLNSINNYVLQNKIAEATEYITKFSSLVRQVLQATNKNLITLKEELEFLDVYIKLEQMRLKNSFVFEKKIDKRININKLEVVPLFLQPFIENAIWHGLSLKRGVKKIVLNIVVKNNRVVVLIIDNGIGFKASEKRKQSQYVKRKSYGINIVKERLELMYKGKTSVVVNDISKDVITGTEVEITFPFN